jgi:hypothetical protein
LLFVFVVNTPRCRLHITAIDSVLHTVEFDYHHQNDRDEDRGCSANYHFTDIHAWNKIRFTHTLSSGWKCTMVAGEHGRLTPFLIRWDDSV